MHAFAFIHLHSRENDEDDDDNVEQQTTTTTGNNDMMQYTRSCHDEIQAAVGINLKGQLIILSVGIFKAQEPF